jgi:hypothetical protein
MDKGFRLPLNDDFGRTLKALFQNLFEITEKSQELFQV